MTATLERASTDIVQRLESVRPDAGDHERERKQIVSAFRETLLDPVFVAKARKAFADPMFYGGKFGRHGLLPADVEFLHDLMVSNHSQYGYGPSEQLQNAYREVCLRTMYTGSAGFGAEFIGTQYVNDLWTTARSTSAILGLIPSFEMTNSTAWLPIALNPPEILLMPYDSGAFNSSEFPTTAPNTDRIRVDARKFVAHTMWSGELVEDTILPFMPYLRDTMGRSLGYYGDSAVLNGDTTNAATGNINLDDANPPDDKHYLAFDGLRHAALVDNSANSIDVSGAVTFGLLGQMRALMNDSAINLHWGMPNDVRGLIVVADRDTAFALAGLDELKFAWPPNPLPHQVATWASHPIVVSGASSLTEADGKVSETGGNNTQGQITMFNRHALAFGWRRRIKLEVDRHPETDQTAIVAHVRAGLGRYSSGVDASGIESVAVAYNITL